MSDKPKTSNNVGNTPKIPTDYSTRSGANTPTYRRPVPPPPPKKK